jgi:ATP-binding cassette subfamily F protein 3
VHIGYFAQARIELVPQHTVLESLLDAKHMPTSQARGLLGRYLFSGDDVFKLVGDLSGGEQSRLALARLTLQGANVLLLDEPTNHLDIPSQEVLQQTLAEFEGTVVLVTHDRYLIHALSTAVWAIAEWELHEFREGYDDFRSWLAAQKEERRLLHAAEKAPSAQERESSKAAQREMMQRIREITEMEQRIQSLEARLVVLSEALELAGGAQQVDRVRELGIEYEQVESELQTCLALWAEVAE